MVLSLHAERGRAGRRNEISVIDQPPHRSGNTLQLPGDRVDEGPEEEDSKSHTDNGHDIVPIPFEHTSAID